MDQDCAGGLPLALHEDGRIRLGTWRLPSGNAVTVIGVPTLHPGSKVHTHEEWDRHPTREDRRSLLALEPEVVRRFREAFEAVGVIHRVRLEPEEPDDP